MKSLKILLDECIDWRLGRLITGHQVLSARQANLAGLKNGELLTKAALEFDVFVTVDRNLVSQQNLLKYKIAIIVLRSKSNRLEDLSELVPAIIAALMQCAHHQVVYVGE